MKYLYDTCILIDYLRGKEETKKYFMSKEYLGLECRQ